MAEESLPTRELAIVRRFEAAAFRAWPAAAVQYDGTWLIRLTAGHPAKRLNSVNPLDPGDAVNIDKRIEKASRKFEAYGRPLTFRLSPLAGEKLDRHLDSHGWSRFDESIVMRLRMDQVSFDNAIHQIPLKDTSRFIAAAVKIKALNPAHRPGLSELINSIGPEAGLFVVKQGDDPLATAICVQDGDLAGLFEVATHPDERGSGHGRRIVLSALNWARLKGAKQGWLQVQADNEPAVNLYRSLGFEEIYRYAYRRPPVPDQG